MSSSPAAPDRWQAWDRLLATTPETGFMQSSWWAEFRTTAGFEHFRIMQKNGGAILGGAVVLKFTYADDRCFYYVPEGPVLPADEAVAGAVFDATLEAIEDRRRTEPQTVSHLRMPPLRSSPAAGEVVPREPRQIRLRIPVERFAVPGPDGVQPRELKDAPGGNLVGIVGASVGFGSNFMNAIYAEQRLILNNGSHRAFALRQMGVTHVPCIVQHVSSRDELEVVGSTALRRDPDLYLKHPRPPMLTDYFNPQLRMVLPVHRRLRQITVRLEVEEDFVPAL